jgi:hypothetical protein
VEAAPEADAPRPAQPRFPVEWGDNCPPGAAQGVKGTLYRRVRCSPPSADDFRSVAEEGKRKVSAEKECQARGLSVFRALEDARWFAELYPGTGSQIAQAELDESDGKAMPTPNNGNSHTTWWPHYGIERHTKFTTLP